MKKLTALLIFTSALLIAACSSGPKKDKPSELDPLWQGPGKNYSAKQFTRARTWAAGHYVINGNIVNGRKDTVTRTLIVGKEGRGWIIESTSTNRDGKVTGMQMLITGYEDAVKTGKSDQIRVVWMKLLNEDGTVQQLEEAQIMVYNYALQSTWARLLNYDLKYSDGGAVTVPAGTFAGTSKASVSMRIVFKTFKSTSWFHPDVPVNGVVRTLSDDKKNETVLLDFGFNGRPIIK